MKLRLALLATATFAGTAQANTCAAPPSRVNNLNMSGIVNSYYPVVPSGVNTGGYTGGTTTFSVGPALSCGGCGTPESIGVGDMVMIIQHQDAQINNADTTAYGANNGSGRGITSSQHVTRFQFLRVTASTVTTGAGGSLTVVSGNNGGVDFSFGTGPTVGRLRGGQIIKVPQLANVTLGGTVTAPFFQNGTITNGQLQQAGGIVVLDVAGTLNMNGQTIDVSGRGFRGGGGRQYTGTATAGVTSTDYREVSSATTTGAHGSKGEGITGTPRFVNQNSTVLDNGSLSNGGSPDGYPAGSVGRGAPGTAGGGGTDNAPTPATTGNTQNTGGGGGAGHGGGGQGGDFNGVGSPGLGGFGINPSALTGFNLTNSSVGGIWQMAAMGGGGGAGSANDAVGAAAAAASGGSGGGIVIIRANAFTGTGTINANGASATTGPSGDAAGGGGGGGWIILAAADQTQVATPSISLQANGGNGGSTTGGGNNSGPGGGGGGGGVAVTTNLVGGVSTSVQGGNPGTAVGTSTGAAAGSAGLSTTYASIYHIGIGTLAQNGTSSRSVSAGAECVPIITKSYTPFSAASGANRTFTVNVKNPNAGTYPRNMTNVVFTDTYPAGVVNAATPNLTNNGTPDCGTPSQTATPGVGTFEVSGGTFPGGSTCTFTMTVTATGTGTLTNTIPQDSADAIVDGVATKNASPATASLTFPSTVGGSKTSQVVSDPINNTSNPKRIPGAIVDYQITINNTAGAVLDNNTMVISDALPFASVKLFVGNLVGGQPYEFTPNASNLTCAACITYSTLANPNVANDADWTYSPTPDGDGADAAVRHIRFKTTGSMAIGSQVTFRYRTLVK